MSKSRKMVTCKHCGAEIAANAKSCPKCGGINKKPFYKKWWFWLIVAVILICPFFGKGSEGGEESPEVSSAVSESSEKEYIETALYLISTPNTGLFFAYCSIYCGFVGLLELAHYGLSLVCRLNIL